MIADEGVEGVCIGLWAATHVSSAVLTEGSGRAGVNV